MYGKLFEAMFDGTLTTKGPWQALVTFQQLIILADPKGNVDMTPETIARRTTIPIEIITKGIEALEQPDPDSRTPVEDGRRIVRLSDNRAWGWRIVNHAKYRKIRSQEERRKYMREYQRKRRGSTPNVNQEVNNINHSQPESTDATPDNQMQYAVCSTPVVPLKGAAAMESHRSTRQRRRLPRTACPDSFEVTEEMANWAQARGLPPDRALSETEKFLRYHRASGSLFAKWDQAWANWIVKAVEFRREAA